MTIKFLTNNKISRFKMFIRGLHHCNRCGFTFSKDIKHECYFTDDMGGFRIRCLRN